MRGEFGRRVDPAKGDVGGGELLDQCADVNRRTAIDGDRRPGDQPPADPDQARWSFSSQQANLRRLDKAMTGFFRRVKAGRTPGYPRFKGAGWFDSVTWPKDGEQWKTGGGPVWVTGNYDPETNLSFWGVGNGGPWMGDQRPGDNLYTSGMVAIDVANGMPWWWVANIGGSCLLIGVIVLTLMVGERMSGGNAK